MLGGNYVNRFSNQGRSYKVIPQVKRVQRLNADQLKNFYVSGREREAASSSRPSPRLKTHDGAAHAQPFPATQLRQDPGRHPSGRHAGSGAEGAGKEAAKDSAQGLHHRLRRRLARSCAWRAASSDRTLILSVILIFLVLAAQFESFRDPFIILLGSVPLALSGALLFGFLGFTTLNIYSQVGLITLVGLVSKNGILIVEFANKLQESGMDKLRAVIEAAGTRLRPILMTSVATVVGHFPLVLARGPGAGSRNSIGYRARHRHDRRHFVHPVRRPFHLHGHRARSQWLRSCAYR